MNHKYFFAVDLGATSGRTIVGGLTDGKITLEELTRFDNNLIEVNGHFYWDIYALYFEVIKGLKVARQRNIEISFLFIRYRLSFFMWSLYLYFRDREPCPVKYLTVNHVERSSPDLTIICLVEETVDIKHNLFFICFA